MKGSVSMDLLPYIESRAIREHIAASGHRFNAMEAAVLIQNNESISQSDRIPLWRELLYCSEDMPLPVNAWFPKPMTLHEWLKEDVCFFELAKAQFEKEEADAVWLADGDREFSSFAACLDALRASGSYVQKVWLESGAARTIEAILLPGGGYAHIDADHSGLPKRSSIMGLYSFWIDVPTPFQKGDLLKGKDGELCILLDDERRHMTGKEHREREISGCFLDMCVSVAILGDGTTPGHDLSPVEYPYLLLDYPNNKNNAAQRGERSDRRAQ
jgi:hypothetical protein